MTGTTTQPQFAGNLTVVESLAALSQPLSILETFMKWQTPAASDFRFGFEITMYIANR